jgi:hypothetical protein
VTTEGKAPTFKIKGWIPVALYADPETRQYKVLFENDREQAVGHETCAAWQSVIERWAEGRAW